MGLKHPGYQALNLIGRKGRALGFFIISATQSVEMSEIGNLRKHVVNKITVKQDSSGFNKYMLGDDAAEHGFDFTAIPASTPDNGYKYAGIGYVKNSAGHPELVRFAYSDDEAIISLCLEVQEHLRGKDGQELPTPTAHPKREEGSEKLPDLDGFEW